MLSFLERVSKKDNSVCKVCLGRAIVCNVTQLETKALVITVRERLRGRRALHGLLQGVSRKHNRVSRKGSSVSRKEKGVFRKGNSVSRKEHGVFRKPNPTSRKIRRQTR